MYLLFLKDCIIRYVDKHNLISTIPYLAIDFLGYSFHRHEGGRIDGVGAEDIHMLTKHEAASSNRIEI